MKKSKNYAEIATRHYAYYDKTASLKGVTGLWVKGYLGFATAKEIVNHFGWE